MPNRIIAPNLAELYRQAAGRYGSLPAFATRRRALEWIPVSFQELYERGLDLASGLIDLGVAAREHVGLFADNRQEWILADYGVQLCGAADVPRGRDITDRELVYIVNHAQIKAAFFETREMVEQAFRLRHEMPGLRVFIQLDQEVAPPGEALRIGEVCARGASLRGADGSIVAGRIKGIRPDDLFTLIYTSGTTGRPKGVMLTHANITSQIAKVQIPVACTDRVLSILPIWHIFERIFEMIAISGGGCVYYSSVRRLGEDLKNVEPTFMGSAPRLWESLHQRILKNVHASHPVRRVLFHIAYFLGRHYQESLFFLTGRRLALHPPRKWRTALLSIIHLCRWLLLLPWYGFFNAAVLERIRQAAGGSIKGTVSGGGALPVEIDRFFNYIGIPVLEGYGMTETSPVLAVRTPRSLVIGTVGPPVDDTDIRIVNPDTREILFPDAARPHGGLGLRGEICVRGPQVMKGYYRDPETTGKVLCEGWMHTGDLGMMTFNGCLKILGRCKETVVLSSGENLEPGPIEMVLRQSPLIDQCMVVGQDRKYIAALIVPDPAGFGDMGIQGSHAELAESGEARRLIQEEIRVRISRTGGFKAFEHIHEFCLVPKPFEVGDELTNLYKLKRHVIEERYAESISLMFEPQAGREKGGIVPDGN